MSSHPITRFYPYPQTGLSSDQVALRKESGLVNATPEKITKTTGEIIRDNLCTLFNFFNLLIAVALASVGAWKNMVFILVILMNTLIGILQELHAKRLVDRLSLLSMPHATVVRDGLEQTIPVEELVLDDIILLESGGQVCADSILMNSNAEVNESLLTGESDPVGKSPGDLILSGSFIISGKCRAKVEHIGDNNFASRLASEAKKLKKTNSELLSSMRKVTRFTGFLIVPLGILLFAESFLVRQALLSDSVVSTAAGLLGMLPKGLVLLISISLAVGVGRLAKKQVLVQDLYSLETLAHVDVLCLDKTGTITEGKMKVKDVVLLEPAASFPFELVMGSFLHFTDDNNATFQALHAHFKENSRCQPIHQIPFSSQRKWSAMTFPEFGTLVLGAPERLSKKPLSGELTKELHSGTRIIMAGVTSEPVLPDRELPHIRPLCAILISDTIRAGARETLAYFKREGVKLKVISGDNPAAVSCIADQAGLPGARNYVDMSGLTSDEEIRQAAEAYTVFGRVSPQQKKQLVQALQRDGHSVAMTGDGVNDILALREADCSISVAEGSDAARQVSQLVLLNSDFSSLPQVVAEGRRVVNNITRVAGIFFVKTIYSILLSAYCAAANIPFPFLPIQITLIDLMIEGYPSFFLSFEPDGRKIQERFLPAVLRRAAPNALAITALAMITEHLAVGIGMPDEMLTVILYLLVGVLGIEAVLKACVPLNRLRMFLSVTTAAGFFTAVFLFHDLLQLPLLPRADLPLFVMVICTGLLFERCISLIIDRRRYETPYKKRYPRRSLNASRGLFYLVFVSERHQRDIRILVRSHDKEADILSDAVQKLFQRFVFQKIQLIDHPFHPIWLLTDIHGVFYAFTEKQSVGRSQGEHVLSAVQRAKGSISTHHIYKTAVRSPIGEKPGRQFQASNPEATLLPMADPL